MVLQPGVKPLRIGIPLEQHGGQKALAPFGRQQAGARSRIATPLASDSLAFAGPPTVSIGATLKSTFIHIDELISSLGQMKGAYLLEIRRAFARIAFSVPKSFFYT